MLYIEYLEKILSPKIFLKLNFINLGKWLLGKECNIFLRYNAEIDCIERFSDTLSYTDNIIAVYWIFGIIAVYWIFGKNFESEDFSKIEFY